jgi:predicted RNA binding protein YcfA (HicA-like mRNA interferase family)
MKKFRSLFEKSDPCWKGYEMVGMKDKNGKKVPNCVPVKESLDEQIQMLDEMPGANMDTRAVHQHLKKQGWSLTRSSGGHDVFTHPEAKHHIPVPRHRQLKAPLVKGILKQSQVNEAQDVGEYDYEGQMARTQLQTTMRNCKDLIEMIKDDDNMPEWVQSKITLAQDYITTVRDYLQSKEELGEEVEQLKEGRPSQRHPLEGHEYHKKSNVELVGIAKDAHAAAEAMKSHNTTAENKYRDQANDSATVRYYRQKHGMQPWYKKKYGHVNEEVVSEDISFEPVNGTPSKTSAGHTIVGHSFHSNGTKHANIVKHGETGKYFAAGGSSSHPVKSTTYHDSPEDAVKSKKSYVKEESLEEGKKPGHLNPGWMLKADPKLAAKVDANKKKYKSFTQNVGKKLVKEDDVINANSQNSIDGVKVKKDKDIERYVTGQSSQVAGTNVVASPRESVQEGVAMDIAKMAARRNAGLKENATNDSTLTSYDKEDTPAKKTLSKTAGMVKDLADKAKTKAKGKKSDDTFQPEPELASNIVR